MIIIKRLGLHLLIWFSRCFDSGKYVQQRDQYIMPFNFPAVHHFYATQDFILSRHKSEAGYLFIFRE
jgi:hypothetical protein